MRRTILATGVLVTGVLLTGVLGLATAALPATAAVEPNVPDTRITESVRDVGASDAVRDIDLSAAVVPLETEETDGRQVTLLTVASSARRTSTG